MNMPDSTHITHQTSVMELKFVRQLNLISDCQLKTASQILVNQWN